MTIPHHLWTTRVATGLMSLGAVLSLSSCGLPLPLPGLPDVAEERGDAPRDDSAEEQADQAGPAAEEGEFRTGPVPNGSADFDDLPEVDSTDPAEQVEGELANVVQEFAMTEDPSTDAACDGFDSSADSVVDCNVTFQGIDVPFEVEISGGESVFSYTPDPVEGMVASRDALEDETRYHTGNESVRCTMDEFQLVPVGEDIPDLTCHAKDDPDEYTVSVSAYGSIYLSRVY
ncbi:hypothetical protein [Allosalinactinospora lopnorensis]|uniref:hypothetical protein n=1 Tax=Allosalinactinospora lopnorensis TaxID=1352348 RepID=UPI000623CA66|nr:hypothetical protein [Allosalinactinospora lopnorensis]